MRKPLTLLVVCIITLLTYQAIAQIGHETEGEVQDSLVAATHEQAAPGEMEHSPEHNQTADTGSTTPFTLVQPSVTVNYIIKVQ